MKAGCQERVKEKRGGGGGEGGLGEEEQYRKSTAMSSI